MTPVRNSCGNDWMIHLIHFEYCLDHWYHLHGKNWMVGSTIYHHTAAPSCFPLHACSNLHVPSLLRSCWASLAKGETATGPYACPTCNRQDWWPTTTSTLPWIWFFSMMRFSMSVAPCLVQSYRGSSKDICEPHECLTEHP
jgi:hypothetical protein